MIVHFCLILLLLFSLHLSFAEEPPSRADVPSECTQSQEINSDHIQDVVQDVVKDSPNCPPPSPPERSQDLVTNIEEMTPQANEKAMVAAAPFVESAPVIVAPGEESAPVIVAPSIEESAPVIVAPPVEEKVTVEAPREGSVVQPNPLPAVQHDQCVEILGKQSKSALLFGEQEKKDCYVVNFDDVEVIQLIRFITQISDTNFVFDTKDLKDIKVSIISDEPTSVKDLMASLLQVLRMHGLSVVEQGNNVIIHRDHIGRVSTIVTDANVNLVEKRPIVTRVFRLFNLTPGKVAIIIKPLLSKDAIVEESPETRHLIVSDITANVDKIAELLNALDTPNAALDVAEYNVKSAFPSVLVSYAKEILIPLAQGNPIQFIAQQSAHKIFIVSTPYLITKAMQVLCSLDIPEISEVIDIPATHVAGNNFFVYKLKYRQGKEIARGIRDIGANLRYMSTANVDLISAISSLQWIEANNSLVVSGTQEAIDKVIDLINDLDVAPKQVYIEVLIIDTTIANSLDFGVQWIALANEQNKLAFASGLLNPAPATAPVATLTGQPQAPVYGGARQAQHTPPPDASRNGAPGTGGDVPLTSGFGLGIVGNIIRHHGQNFLTLGALVSALESDLDTKIVLNPRIMAQDTFEANFFVGQNIPYQTTSTVVRDTGSVTQNLQYEDIGVQLRVTPQVGPNNVVTLLIDQSVSDIVSATASIQSVGQGPTLLLAPTTNKTLTTTRVHVPDGCFLVMSGHIRDHASCTRSGIPCLGTLPLVGPAFSNTAEERDKRNLIMFLRPHVVSNIEEGTALTNSEGYEYNWESHPSSLFTCPPLPAPEYEDCTDFPPETSSRGDSTTRLFTTPPTP